MAVVRRRHLITRKGREVTGLDDEVFDQIAVEDEGLGVAGEGALLAALERNRTGRMGDIVATIQVGTGRGDPRRRPRRLGRRPADRARARRPSRSTGPRTSSTRTGGGSRTRACCSIGPSPVFLRYIEQVLPSLGEQDVQLSTISGLKPRMRVVAADAPAVAALKGDARMAAVIRKAVADRERPLARDLFVLIDGLRVPAVAFRHRPRHRRHAAAARHAQREPPVRRAPALRPPRRPLQERSHPRVPRAQHRLVDPGVTDNVTSMFDRDSTLDASIASTLARGEPTPEGWEQELRRALPQPPRGERGARADVAGAFGRRARERPLRLPGAGAVGVGLDADRNRTASSCIAAAIPTSPRRRGPRPTSRWSTKPTRCSDRSRRPGPSPVAAGTAATPSTPPSGSSTISGCAATPTRQRSRAASAMPATATATRPSRRSSRARSATCWSTRRKTSRPCNGGCSPGAARPDR